MKISNTDASNICARPAAGTMENALAFRATVCLIAIIIATNNDARSPHIASDLIVREPLVIKPIPTIERAIAQINLEFRGSFRIILLAIAANIGEVLIMNREFATDVVLMAYTNKSEAVASRKIYTYPAHPALEISLTGFFLSTRARTRIITVPEIKERQKVRLNVEVWISLMNRLSGTKEITAIRIMIRPFDRSLIAIITNQLETGSIQIYLRFLC